MKWLIKLVDNRRNSFIFILTIGIISLISLNVLAYSILDTKISTNNTEYKINNNEEVNVTYMVQLQDLSARYFGDSFWNGYNYVEELRNITLDLNVPKGMQVKEIKWSQDGINENINIDGANLNSIKFPNVEYKLSGNWWDRYYSADPFKITIKYIGKNLKNEAINEYIVDGSIKINGSTLANLPEVKFTVNNGLNVNISVSDSRGILGKTYNTENDKANKIYYEDLTQDNTLIGRGLANFKVSGIAKNKNSDYYLKYRFIKKGQDNNTEWKSILLTTNSINADIDYDNPNNLTFRSYDVNHLPTLSGNSQWSDPNLVFKNPSSNIKYLPTTIASSKSQYGHLASYIDSDGVTQYKWVPNMAFYNEMAIGGEYKEAAKYWGYIKPKKTGWYILGIFSDDGAKGSITVDKKAYEFSKYGFYPHVARYFSNKNANPIYLSKNEYYPISLEYFNWGGDGVFKVGYQYSEHRDYGYGYRKFMGEDGSAFTFYPSKSKEPGENADGIFTGGKDGIPFPSEEGSYYIDYRIVSIDNNNDSNQEVLKEGKYGYFNVENRFITNISIENGEKLIQGKKYDLKYTLKPKPIATKDISNISSDKLPDTIRLTDIKINGMLPPGIKFVSESNSNLNENSNSYYIIEKSGDETPNGTNFTIKFSNDLVYTLDKNDMMYKAEIIEIPVKIQIGRIGEFIFNGSDNRITYKYSGKDMATITQYFPTININAISSSKIIKMGILDSAVKPSNIGNVNSISNVVNGIPSKVALSVKINSLGTIINVSLNSNYLRTGNRDITVSKYKIINGNVDFGKSETAEFSLNNNNISIKDKDKFKLEEGTDYLIVINITPDIPNVEQLKVVGSIEGASDMDKHYAILQPTEMPDVF
ncbi:PA14 domain-containing protein [Clostridium perfringens]|uniref:PA14 domain-containing protein n=1 Tax=Clostridium perfringens TaxID=1502 RepID=UPI00351513EE